MFQEAMTYPAEDEEYLNTLLIGTLLVIGSIFILPAFVLMGFIVRTIQAASDGNPVPRFEDYTGLFIDGLKLTGALLTYTAGFIALMFLTLFAGEISQIAGQILFLITALAYFSLIYLLPSIVYRFSLNRSITDALQIRDVVRTAATVQYLTVLLVLFLVHILFTALQIGLLITVIGILLIPTSYVYELMVYARLMAEIEA